MAAAGSHQLEKASTMPGDEDEEADSGTRLLVMLFVATLVAATFVAVAFVAETTVVLGGRSFTERFEQPWFRVPHYEHHRVEVADKANSAFGKHYIPPDDVFVPPDWTYDETQYLPCLSRQCVCPYFGGKYRGQKCILKNGKPLKKALRQEIRTLSDDKRRMWERTLNKLKKSGTYNRLSRVHKYSGVHSGPAFTLWHREFLKRMELVIRRHLPDPSMGIPYWDSSLDALLPEPRDSIMFSSLFLGDVDEEGHVVTGPYANWTTMEGAPHITRKFGANPGGELLNDARIDWVTYNPDINMVLGTTMPLTTCPMNHSLDARMFEYSHDYVHFFIDGDMGGSHSSSNDVIFIYHHSMIDLIFETWRQNMGMSTERLEAEYPPDHPDCFPYWHNIDRDMPMLQPFKNRNAMSGNYSSEMYEFAPRPTCNSHDRNCGSKYLFCVVNNKTPPFCMSKVRMWGNCSNLEEFNVCFNGRCINGRCEPHPVLRNRVPQSLKFIM